MQTVSYSTLISELNALTGIDSFSSTEKSWLNSLINRRIRNAYEMSPFWPRYTVEELRYAGFDNVIPADQNGKSSIDLTHSVWSQNPRNKARMATRHKSVATSDGWKLLGLEDGDYQDPYLELSGLRSGTIYNDESQYINAGSSLIRAVSFWLRINSTAYTTNPATDIFGQILYTNTDATSTANQINITLDGKLGGGALVVDAEYISNGLSNIYLNGVLSGTNFEANLGALGTVNDNDWIMVVCSLPSVSSASFPANNIRIGVNTYPSVLQPVDDFDIADVRLYDATLTDTDVANLYANPTKMLSSTFWASSLPEYWVSYKKQLTSTFGDNTPVPMEFKEYAVHGAYADWLRAEGQTDKATVEEAFANECIMRQLNKISYTNGSDKLWQSISTHSSTQSR